MKTLLTGLFFLFAICEMAFAIYYWPLDPHNQAHTTASTLDERRGSRRFHRGVDIDGDLNETVYARFGAIVARIGTDRVMLDNDGRGFYYLHIDPDDNLPPVGQPVSTNDPVGTIIEYRNTTHLHFEEGPFNDDPEATWEEMNFPEYNPLRAGGLSPQYNPPNNPRIDEIILYENETTTQIDPNQYTGQIFDIVAHTYAHVVGNISTGVYLAGFEIEDSSGSIVIPLIFNIMFERGMDNDSALVRLVYKSHHHLVLTNHIETDTNPDGTDFDSSAQLTQPGTYTLRLYIFDILGNRAPVNQSELTIQHVGGGAPPLNSTRFDKKYFPTLSAIPLKSALLQAYPSPANPETWIPFELSQGADITIRIYNTQGHLIRILALGRKEAGYYIEKPKAAYWDGRNDAGERVSSGIYFYQLQAGRFISTRKMLILK